MLTLTREPTTWCFLSQEACSLSSPSLVLKTWKVPGERLSSVSSETGNTGMSRSSRWLGLLGSKGKPSVCIWSATEGLGWVFHTSEDSRTVLHSRLPSQVTLTCGKLTSKPNITVVSSTCQFKWYHEKRHLDFF